MDFLVPRSVLISLVDHSIVRADLRRIADTMQIMPLGSFNRQKPTRVELEHSFGSDLLNSQIIPLRTPYLWLQLGVPVLDDHSGHSFGMHDG